MLFTDYPNTSIPVTSQPPSGPPEAWGVARRLVQRVARPLERYMHVEASSGIVLLAAALVALLWANSPFADSYEHLWHTPITLTVGAWSFSESLHFFINDGLMVIFFFVVGLEIRREIHQGELSDLRRAALPAVAALGGMLVPAFIYLAWSSGSPVSHGWGVPMATDIAFAVGVLALLGKRVPAALRVLLLALAIIDDIGAIVVIAVFFSSDFAPVGLLVASAGAGLVIALQRIGVRRPLAYVPAGFIVWVGMLKAGVHPTVAGVILGLLTPVKSWFGRKGFLSVVRKTVIELKRRTAGDEHLLGPLAELGDAQREAVPPVVRLQAALHPWVAFGIMPLFALANAGVNVSDVDLNLNGASLIASGVITGLVLGKPIGVLLASVITVKLGVCALPRGVNWRGVSVVGAVAGIGFTMAVFVAGLAFEDAAQLGVAKLAVLVSSAVAAVFALTAGRFLLPRDLPADVVNITVDQAEASTEL